MRPRDLVMSHLRAVGEVTDPDGRASAALAEAVGYAGTSLAFAQLLHGMERSGLIEREVRGKRTYRIALASRMAARAPERDFGSAEPENPDYDRLARRLLAEVVRRIAASGDVGPSHLARTDYAAVDLARTDLARTDLARVDLARTVASLERKLASVEATQQSLRAENERLRELLDETRQDLADQKVLPISAPGSQEQHSGRTDTGEVQLLERLLASLRQESPGESALGRPCWHRAGRPLSTGCF